MAIVNRNRKHDFDHEHIASPAYFRLKQWRRGTSIQEPSLQDLEAAAAFTLSSRQKSMAECFRALADRLCAEHPDISTDSAIFGGMPHIRDVRLSVGDVLAQLYTYGSIQEILIIYSPDINEEQIKEAIAYAQDFLETACDPR
jgi:uncharacterized protein (DUF433 family)